MRLLLCVYRPDSLPGRLGGFYVTKNIEHTDGNSSPSNHLSQTFFLLVQIQECPPGPFHDQTSLVEPIRLVWPGPEQFPMPIPWSQPHIRINPWGSTSHGSLKDVEDWRLVLAVPSKRTLVSVRYTAIKKSIQYIYQLKPTTVDGIHHHATRLRSQLPRLALVSTQTIY